MSNVKPDPRLLETARSIIAQGRNAYPGTKEQGVIPDRQSAIEAQRHAQAGPPPSQDAVASVLNRTQIQKSVPFSLAKSGSELLIGQTGHLAGDLSRIKDVTLVPDEADLPRHVRNFEKRAAGH